jgi:hypothetical protein
MKILQTAKTKNIWINCVLPRCKRGLLQKQGTQSGNLLKCLFRKNELEHNHSDHPKMAGLNHFWVIRNVQLNRVPAHS